MLHRILMVAALAAALGFPACGVRAAETSARLLPRQLDRIKDRYPDAKVFRTCVGRIGGLSPHDAVVGVMSQGKAHRLGLIWDGHEFVLHDIDTELRKDRHISRSLPFRWNYSVTGDPQEDFRCGFQLGKDDRIGVQGDQPFFDLKRAGLEDRAVVCFETHKTYDDWDCVVFSPKARRFKLWFQQAHAD